MEQEITLTAFAKDILEGLTDSNKHLSSKYFYDDEGSRIFQDIMRMPEYYLTDCELEIFQTQKQEIFEAFTPTNESFELIELGAGDGLKTKVLLAHFLAQKALFEYLPIDISHDAVVNLVDDLKTELPQLKTQGMIGDYFQLLNELNKHSQTKKIVLFLGSNIGNFHEQKALNFLLHLQTVLHSGDLVLIGFDLKKDAEVIIQAYNDPYGHTAAFNLNLLHRINKELHADFQLHNFQHTETYDPQTGTAKSFLISMKKQEVFIKDLNEAVTFEKDEPIFMEMSQKYDQSMIVNLAENTGFNIVRNYYDSRQYYTNSLWQMR